MTDVSSRDQRQMQYVRVNDFSPGCYDASLTVGSTPTTPAFSPGPYPAPMGAADANATYACMNLATGGLGPLPALTRTHTPTDFGYTSPLTGYLNILAFQDSFVGPNDEIVIGAANVLTGGGGQVFGVSINSAIWSSLVTNAIFTESYGFPPHVSPNPVIVPQMPYAFSTRVAASSPTTTVGQAVVVVPVMTGGAGGDSIIVYPNPATPTAYAGLDLLNLGANGNCGPTFGHQNRIVTLASEARAWPGGGTALAFNNLFWELISYTDPPNSETWPNQQSVFGPENPYGYGGVGSVSAGELFMVKQRGGAIIVQGDINNPTITSLPGVKSTGPIYGQVGATQGGMFYCSMDQGAYVWNGGNTSQKISTQLDDNFFTPAPGPGAVLVGPTYGYYCYRWGEWMMFSNSWMYNTTSGGWWRLCNPATFSWFFYTSGYNANQVFTSLLSANLASPCFGQYDKTVPVNAYQWQSLPIRPTANARTVNFREVTVRAANVTLDPNSKITVSVLDQVGNVTALPPWTMSSTTREVQIHNFNVSEKQVDSLIVRLNCTGTTAAPVVYDLNLGYRVREGAAVT